MDCNGLWRRHVHIMTKEKENSNDIEKIWKESKPKVESKRKAKS